MKTMEKRVIFRVSPEEHMALLEMRGKAFDCWSVTQLLRYAVRVLRTMYLDQKYPTMSDMVDAARPLTDQEYRNLVKKSADQADAGEQPADQADAGEQPADQAVELAPLESATPIGEISPADGMSDTASYIHRTFCKGKAKKPRKAKVSDKASTPAKGGKRKGKNA